MRHQHIVDTVTYPNDASDPRVQGNEWNEDHVLPALSADPVDPAEGQSFMWMSDGTESGDAGDIMMKITSGGVTITVTLVDFSDSGAITDGLLLETGDYILLETGDFLLQE